MKTIILALLLSASTAFSADDVAEFIYLPGFERNPIAIRLLIDSDGLVKASVKDYRAGTTTNKVLAKLAPTSVKTIVSLSQKLDGAKAVDPKEGEPRCTDTPTLRYFAITGGEKTLIRQTAGCHEWKVEDSQLYWEADRVISILNGFRSIIR